jgi:hypothetical protein
LSVPPDTLADMGSGIEAVDRPRLVTADVPVTVYDHG